MVVKKSKDEEIDSADALDMPEVVKSDGDSASFMGKARGNPWMVASIVLGVVLVIVLIVTGTGITGGVVNGSTAGQNLVDYINSRGNGATATIVSVEKDGTMYKATVDVDGQVLPVYITTDGKYAVVNPIPLTEMTDTSSTTDTTAKEVPKTDKPTVELFVMSFCPYGNKAEDTLLPVYTLLKDKVSWKIHYIVSVDSSNKVTSLHGQPEVDQDMREACVLRDYGVEKLFKFMTYVNDNCGSDGKCWQQAATASGVPAQKITDCVTKDGVTLMKAEAAASDAAGASGSPTMIVNGVQTNAVYQYGDSAAYQTAICSAFTTAPSACSTAVDSTASAAAAAAQGGSCG